MPLTNKQLAKVHLARKQSGVSEPRYRAMLAHLGVDSSKDLDNDGLDKLLDWFVDMGFHDYTRHRSGFGERPGMATDSQVAYIRNLWRQYTGTRNDAALDHWLRHYFRVSSVRFLTGEKASRAIEALKNMAGRARGGRGGPDDAA